MSFRVYLVVGVFVGGFIFLIGTLVGDDFLKWLQEQQFEAAIRSQSVLELVVFEPLIFIFENRPWGFVLAGLLWPAVFVWMLLLLLSMLIIAGVDVTRDIEEVTSLLIL